MLDRQKVLRMAVERTAISSQCQTRQGCIWCTKCTIQMCSCFWRCSCCPTPGLPLNSKCGPVRQQLQQKACKILLLLLLRVWASASSNGSCAPRVPRLDASAWAASLSRLRLSMPLQRFADSGQKHSPNILTARNYQPSYGVHRADTPRLSAL